MYEQSPKWWRFAIQRVAMCLALVCAFWLGEANADCEYNGWNPIVYFQMGQAIKSSPFASLSTGLSEFVAHNQRAMAAGMVGCVTTGVAAYINGPAWALKFGLGWLQGVQPSTDGGMKAIPSHPAHHAVMSGIPQAASVIGQHMLQHHPQQPASPYVMPPKTQALPYVANHELHPHFHPNSIPIQDSIHPYYQLQNLNYHNVHPVMYYPSSFAGVQQNAKTPLAITA